MANRTLTRREFGHASMVALLSAHGLAAAYKGAAQTDCLPGERSFGSASRAIPKSRLRSLK